MSTKAEFLELVENEATPVLLHREIAGTLCPCLTPEGFRDPEWHAKVAAAYAPAPLGDVDLIDPGVVTGSLRYRLGYQWEIPGFPVFHVLNNPSPAVEAVGNSPFVNFDSFDATTIPDPITFLRLYRSVGVGPFYEIAFWGFTVGGANENNPANFVGPLATPAPVVCNAAGVLPGTIQNLNFKGFVQPIQSSRATRLQDERLPINRGEIQTDDHLGIFPVEWGGTRLEFWDWPESGTDYIQYQGRRFQVVNANMIPGPGGEPEHHWEVALRLRSTI